MLVQKMQVYIFFNAEKKKMILKKLILKTDSLGVCTPALATIRIDNEWTHTHIRDTS